MYFCDGDAPAAPPSPQTSLSSIGWSYRHVYNCAFYWWSSSRALVEPWATLVDPSGALLEHNAIDFLFCCPPLVSTRPVLARSHDVLTIAKKEAMLARPLHKVHQGSNRSPKRVSNRAQKFRRFWGLFLFFNGILMPIWGFNYSKMAN